MGPSATVDSAISNSSIRPAESGIRIGTADENGLILGDEFGEAPGVLREADAPCDPHERRLVVGVALPCPGLAELSKRAGL